MSVNTIKPPSASLGLTEICCRFISCSKRIGFLIGCFDERNAKNHENE